VQPVHRFTNRQVATTRISKALQRLAPSGDAEKGARRRKGPGLPGRRRRQRDVSLMRFDGVNAFSFALGRSNLQPQFLLQLAADESADAMGLPAGRFS